MSDQPTYSHAGRQYRRGCLPRTATACGDGTYRVFGDGTPPVLDPKDWPEHAKSMEEHVPHVIDQGSQGSCCGCAGVGAMMLARSVSGQDTVVLSQASLYALGNGGRDGGMAIDVCLRHLIDTGANPIDVIDQYDWQGFYRRPRWSDDWRESAKRYRCIEAWDCPDYEAAVSAVLHGFPVVYGTDGHAVVMIGWAEKTGHIDLNSWGRDWGENGIGQWASERAVRRQLPGYGAWALRVATDPNNDGDI
ncbi:MAG: hypothetical protein HQ581_14930 [Planctomycetes bacterium]|nr:hypothetical protein [Planctomycetota bacterium]